MSYIIKCDRCSKAGAESPNAHVPKGWENIGLSTKVGGGTRYRWHQFCPECVESLGIASEPTEETSAEKLVAILESMVDEAVDERA